MQYQDDKLLYSPSDLVNYTRSPFISWMDRWATEAPEIKELKDEPNAMLAHLASKGYEHEAAFLDVLRAEYQTITAHDILIVAPFNHQVNELKKAIGFNARVGTVDMFQGQEAPIVILSMTANLAIESPRGADFLLNINRLNVAVSRAQALAVVVHAESLLDGTPNRIEDIQRFNLFQQLLNENRSK